VISREDTERIVRRVLERLEGRLPPGLAGDYVARWDEPIDEEAHDTPTRGPHSGRCAGCPSLGQCAWVCAATTTELVRRGADRIGATLGARSLDRSVASAIDHTLLKADATASEIDQLCEEARRYAFASVCVNGHWVRRAHERLSGSSVLVCSVVGFPLGATLPEIKAAEAALAVEEGAREIDMVIAIGALKSKDHRFVHRDIAGVVAAARVPVKVILETAYLTREEKVEACSIAQAAGAAFVKTSTGFGPSGATLDDIRLMREAIGPWMSIKASGGIRTPDFAQALLEAGADRIGASASVAIAEGSRR
jgi:deoxyribose-phosphate aldolase